MPWTWTSVSTKLDLPDLIAKLNTRMKGVEHAAEVDLSRTVLTDEIRTVTVSHVWSASQTLNGGFTGGASANITINTNKFTVAASSGNTAIGGTLNVTGATTLAALTCGAITATGNSTITGTLGGVTTLTATTLAGTLSTAAQPNVTSVGTLTSLTVSGTITASGGKVAFPATQSASADANTLDDYEEGTWTGAFECGTSGTITIDLASGKYTKIGRQVTVSGFFNVASVSAPVGELRLTGLPFTNGAADEASRVAVSVFAQGLAAGATTVIQGAILGGATRIILYKYAAGTSSVLAGDVQAGSGFYITATYTVA